MSREILLLLNRHLNKQALFLKLLFSSYEAINVNKDKYFPTGNLFQLWTYSNCNMPIEMIHSFGDEDGNLRVAFHLYFFFFFFSHLE